MPKKQQYHIPKKKGLTAQQFYGNVRILFEDGSHVFFEGAFTSREDEYIVVYTEHCGYHSFPEASIKKVWELVHKN